MAFLFVRHGETDWNSANKIQGTTDIPLNENGIKQAKLVCEALQNENVKLDRIYSSGKVRALTTANIIGEKYGIEVEIVPGLEEMDFGVFEGHTWEEAESLYAEEFGRWWDNKRYQKITGGESYQDVLVRFFEAFDEICCERKGENDVLLVTHSGVIMTLLTVLNDLDFQTAYMKLNIGNTKVIRLTESELNEIRKKI